VKIHKHSLFLSLVPVLISAFLSCQKKEALQDPIPTPTDSSKVVICPDCEYPDSSWVFNSTKPQLVFRLQLDSTQVRLNNSGQLENPLPGIGVQSPTITGIGIQYIELMPEANTAVGAGVILYQSKQTTCGGNTAVNFCKTLVVKENQIIFSTDLSTLPPGSYKWIRIAIGYQELMIQSRSTSSGNGTSILACFSGDLTYLTKTKVQSTILTPTLGGIGNKTKGYWLFYQNELGNTIRSEGQAPKTTVVNPSLIPNPANGPSFVYGQFFRESNSNYEALQIHGTETSNIEIKLSLSTNRSFEWNEITHDGLFQLEIGESILDFGCRGLIPKL